MNTVSSRTFAEWSLRAGWRLQRDAADVVRSTLSARPDVGRRAMRLLLTTVEESAGGAALFGPGGASRAAWQELRNKVEAFRAFEHVDALLGAPLAGRDLASLVQRAGRLGPPLSVWAAEGVGYHIGTARRVGAHTAEVPALIESALPDWAMIPAHAGMGCALAVHVLNGLDPSVTNAGVENAVERFVELCALHVAAEYRDVALEAFGFAMQSMFEDLHPLIDPIVHTRYPALAPLLWHGAGRAMYFAPTAALPLAATRRRTIEHVLTVAGRYVDRLNVIAGFAWAATLVNLRDPAVLEPHVVMAVSCRHEEAFACGLYDAVEAWRQCAPGDPAIPALQQHVPFAPDVRASWMRFMRAGAARSNYRPGDLFQVAAAGAPHD